MATCRRFARTDSTPSASGRRSCDAARLRGPGEDGREHGPPHPPRFGPPGHRVRLQRGGRADRLRPRRHRVVLAGRPGFQARGAADRVGHGPGRRPDRADRQGALGVAREGRHDRRRRQHQLARRRPPRRRARRDRHPLHRRRDVRRRVGPRGRLLHDGRRLRGIGRAAGADPRRAGPTRRLAPLRRRRRRPLRQDGPQRRGVRDHAGLRRGFRPHAAVEVPDRDEGGRRPLEPRLRRAVVAVRAGRAGLRPGGQRPRRDQGPRVRLGRGPLDDLRRDRPRRPSPGHHRRPVRPAVLARQRRLHEPRAGRVARPVRRARHRASGGRRLMAVAEREQENPLVEGLERLPVPGTNLVIFGATGDLARRKLLPAIYNLAHEGALPERFNLIGVSRREMPDDEFRDFAREAITEFSRREADETVLEGLLERLSYIGFDFGDHDGYKKLAEKLDGMEGEGHPLNRAFYLSTAPEFFGKITTALKEAGLNYRKDSDTRVIIEKPFGVDLESARELQQTVAAAFRERQVFRIDHYLGKETVQNVMAFRFANYMFEPVWNRNYIDSIQITAAEDIGIGSRAGYYDRSGALRDLVQNHMLQLLTLVCMEPPATFEADKVRDEKVKVLEAITPPSPEDVASMTVRAQYTEGVSGGEQVKGYLEEEDVPGDSNTETYAALRLEVHNWRWAGVPIVLRTGKRLARKVTEIAVQLKPVPHLAFQSHGSVGVQPNQLILTMQPNEGVSLSLGAKIPGATMRIRPVNMEFLYGSAFMSQSPEAYERLILDAMRGDATLFTRNDEVDAQWSIIDPILKAWHEGAPDMATYEAGSAGPEEADELIGGGRHWRGL